MATTSTYQPKTVIAPFDPDRLSAHVFARWWLGHHTSRVEFLGGAARIEGSGILFHDPEYLADFTNEKRADFIYANGVKRAEQMLLVVAAGSAAAAGQAECGSGPRAVLDGQDAVRTVARVAEWLGGDPERNWKVAVTRACALLAAPHARAAVCELFELLVDQQCLSGDEIDRICAFWFGGQPFHDHWRESWPPTLEQLREAHVQAFREDEAAVKAMVARANAAAAAATSSN